MPALLKLTQFLNTFPEENPHFDGVHNVAVHSCAYWKSLLTGDRDENNVYDIMNRTTLIGNSHGLLLNTSRIVLVPISILLKSWAPILLMCTGKYNRS